MMLVVKRESENSDTDTANVIIASQQVHVHILPRKLGDFLHNDQVYKEVSCSLVFLLSLERERERE